MVSLTNLNKSKTYTGKVVRVNGKIDQVSQTLNAYIEVSAADLKEGMFLEANLKAKTITNATEISRKLLIDNASVYTVENDSVLTLVTVAPVYFGAETVVIRGLDAGAKILSQPLPGAFEGMIVKINKAE